MKGFTLVEFLLVASIFIVMTTIAAVSLGNFQHRSQLSATVVSLVTDLKEAQVKAMVGYAGSGASAADYGIRFGSTIYTSYKTSYGTNNFVVALPSTITLTYASTSADLVFLKGSGEIPGWASNSAVLTLTDTDGTQKVIKLNKYGVITSVN